MKKATFFLALELDVYQESITVLQYWLFLSSSWKIGLIFHRNEREYGFRWIFKFKIKILIRDFELIHIKLHYIVVRGAVRRNAISPLRPFWSGIFSSLFIHQDSSQLVLTKIINPWVNQNKSIRKFKRSPRSQTE